MKQLDILNYINSIIKKKFGVKAKGYDPDEVDAQLDEIFSEFKNYIEYYQTLEKENEQLKNENKDLRMEIDELEKNKKNLESRLYKLETSGISFDIINERISRLEKESNISKEQANNNKKSIK